MTRLQAASTPAAKERVRRSRLATEAADLAGPGASIARAPLSLDVMGGIAEYTGSLTLSTPAEAGVFVSVRPRDDGRLHVVCFPAASAQNGHRSEWSVALADLRACANGSADAASRRARLDAGGCALKRGAVSVLAALAKESSSLFHGGLTVAIECDVEAGLEPQTVSAVQSATVLAASRALGAELDTLACAKLCRRGQAMLMDRPTGLASHAGPMLGESGRLLQVCCAASEALPPLDLPQGVTVLGMDCGKRPEGAARKYAQARVAAMMGREIIRHIVAAMKLRVSCDDRGEWDGHLARLSVTDYVDSLRDRLPTKVKGGQFLERFGALRIDGEPLEIDPAGVYKVRSRAEHHIYENERVRQFAERVARAARTGDRRAAAEAGELMYASHWSYGQRCGLGSIETDVLVNLLRGEGPTQGILGARISGPGAGGMVVALMDESAAAREAVERSRSAYEQRTSHTITLVPMARMGSVGLSIDQIE